MPLPAFVASLAAPLVTQLLGNGLSSVLGNKSFRNALTGSGLTGAQWQSNAFDALGAVGQMAFQAYMSNTAYRRQVNDMIKAGVNPALVMSGGANGAVAPAGAAPTSESPGSPDAVGLLGQMMNLSLLKAQRDNIVADTEKKKADTEVSYRRLPEIDAAVQKIYSDMDVNTATIDNRVADTAYKESLTAINELNSKWIDALNEAKTLEQKANAARAFAAAAYDNYVTNYGKQHGGQLPGYSQTVGIAHAIENAAGKVLGNDDLDLPKVIGEAIDSYFKSHSAGR